jgi:predicted dehydrogenase
MSTIATDDRGSNSTAGTAPVVRVAVVGLGYWGPNLLRVLSELDGVDVRWICDLDAERLERYGRRNPAVATTRQVEQVFADPEVDAVVIATPVFTHHDLAARALRAGKHVFVEKPMAASSELADALIELAEAEGLALMCGHTFIYSPPVRAVRALLDAGELGDVFFISSNRTNLGLHQRDVSVVWDLGPHDFSILLYWLGELPDSVRAIGRDSIVPGIHDVAFVTMRFPSGIVANVELSWLAPGKLRRTVIVGSQKMCVYDDGTAEPIRLFDHGVVYRDPETFGEYHLSYRTGDILSPRVESYEPLSRELADFTGAVADGRLLREHAAFAQQVVRLTEAADESLRNDGAEVMVGGSRRFRRTAAAVVPVASQAGTVVGGSRA